MSLRDIALFVALMFEVVAGLILLGAFVGWALK
jgi:hypothetical protein